MGRPKLKLPYSQLEKVIEIVSAFLLAGLIILTVFGMIRLPARIPSHFGADGQPNAWGGKGSLLLLPIVGACFYALITLLERFPWIFNYTVEVTEENAPRLYRIGRQGIAAVKLFMLLIFLYIQWETVRVAQGLSTGLGSWFMPVVLVALFGSIGLMIWRMFKNK